MVKSDPRIVVAGAGSVGCFVGGLLAAAGRRVTLLARPRTITDINEHGLTLTDLSGLSRTVQSENLSLTDAPERLASADLVLVTVKSRATDDMAGLIGGFAPRSAPIISLQNGLDNVQTLTTALPNRDVRGGMVSFNVVPMAPGRYHRATSGGIVIGTGPTRLGELLSVPDLMVSESPDITAVQWGKLLLNLNNAVNALSGLTLQDQFIRPEWRRLMADQAAEAYAVIRAAKIPVIAPTPVGPAWIPFVLRLPTPLFRRVAAKMLTIDPTARASMSYDLMENRKTEIDALQGAIISLGKKHRVPTPLSERISGLIRDAETRQAGLPNLSVSEIRG